MEDRIVNKAVATLSDTPVRRFKPYTSYKDSGVEWLGDIPVHWNLKRLRSTVTGCQNGVWGDEPDGLTDVACVRVADFDRVAFRVDITEPTMRSIEQRIVQARAIRAGDLLLEKSGGGEKQPVGAVVIYDHDVLAVCSNFVARMTVADGFFGRFLTYLHAALYSARINTRSIKQSTGIQNLDSASYLSEAAAFPDIDEQRTIAAFLDGETTRIDAMVNKKKRLIELLREKRAALLTRAVTKGLDPNAAMKDSGAEWLGEIPAHWKMSELRRLNRKGTSITYGIVQAGPDVEDGVPYIRTSDMAGDQLPRTGYLRASREIDAAYRRSKVASGDLVVAIRATVGKALLVPAFLEGANLTQGTAKVAPGEKLNGGFLLAALQSGSSKQRFEALSKGATFREITLDMLRRFSIPVPPLAEQAAIADFLNAETAKIDALIAKVREAIDCLKEFRTALISAAVTGKIDVQEVA